MQVYLNSRLTDGQKAVKGKMLQSRASKQSAQSWLGLLLALISLCGATLLLISCSEGDSPVSLPGIGGTGGSGKVAVLIPQSGSFAEIGLQMQNAVMMAYESVDARGDLELEFYDTMSSPEGASAAAARAVDEGAALILGPLSRDSIGLVREQARNLPLITFSNDITQAAANTFISGISPQDVVRRVLAFAQSQNDLRIAVVAPDNQYGRLIVSLIEQEAAPLELQIVTTTLYDASPNANGRQDAARLVASNRGSYDAVIVPDGGSRLREVGALLAFYRVEAWSHQYYGTRLWDDASLVDEPALLGGIFANTPTSRLRIFENAYFERHEEIPAIQAALAFDATALVALLRADNRRLNLANLTDSQGYLGVLGSYRLNPDGTVERLLAIKQLTADGVVTIQPAASNF